MEHSLIGLGLKTSEYSKVVPLSTSFSFLTDKVEKGKVAKQTI